MAGVLALDLAHTVDWDRFASTIAAPLAATIVHARRRNARRRGRSLSRRPFRQRSRRAAAGARRDRRPARGRRPASVAPITHAVVQDVGAVAAFHVSERAWLLAYLPERGAVVSGGRAWRCSAWCWSLLLTGFEVNRRKAEREADRAARALGEKQNLLNTMQVPLIVVDPNTDEIVSANQVAESMGIRRGARFSDRISQRTTGARTLRTDAGRDQRGAACLRCADPRR